MDEQLPQEPNVTYPEFKEPTKIKNGDGQLIKFIRIFLLVLIIIGIGLILTQKKWVPVLVDKILKYEDIQTRAMKQIQMVQE